MNPVGSANGDQPPELHIELAAQAASIGIWDWDLQTNRWCASPTYFTMLGYEPEPGYSDLEVALERIHPDDREAVRAKIQAVIEGRVSVHSYEARLRHADGTYRWIRVIGKGIRDEQGNIVRMTGVREDISEIRRTLEAREEAEARVRQLNRTHAMLTTINQLIVRQRDPQIIMDDACRIAVEQGRFRLAWIGLMTGPAQQLQIAAHAGAESDTVAVLRAIISGSRLGCSFTALAMETGGRAVCNDIASDVDAEDWRDAALQRGYRAMTSFPLVLSGRRIGVLNLYAADAYFFDAEELRLLDALASDIAFALDGCARERERQEAVEKLRVSEERFRELAETIDDVFWIFDRATNRATYVSPGYERVWGRPRQTLYDNPRSGLDAVHADDRDRVMQAAQWRLGAGTFDEQYRIVRPDGEIRWIRDRAYAVRDSNGEIARVVGVARDITERKLLDQHVRETQKLEGIGQLAGGIAHDFNNLVGTIAGNAELARMDLPENHPALESIQEILRAARRARDLVQRILTFSRPQDQQFTAVELRPIVEEAVRLLRATLPATVELVLQKGEQLPAVLADASQIHQIILNLATNAWHAMEAAPGRITFSLEYCGANSVPAAGLPPGPYVRLCVSDTGKGMDEATLERIFEPFFTTKPPGRGTGLGLAVVHGIVRSHRGAITVQSRRGFGTTFNLYFPATEREAPKLPQETSPSAELRGHGERILYLDDDEPLVYLVVRSLERFGYRVTGRTRAEEALADFRRNPSTFALVITDMNMPGMSGMDVARQVMEVRPDIAIVLASGNLRPGEIEAARQAGINDVILKPNSVDDMAATVHRLLSERQRAVE